MNKHEDVWERLDSEFDHFLLDMKPYVLKHPSKTGEHHSAEDSTSPMLPSNINHTT